MMWTEERTAELERLVAEGHSASSIAQRLGGVTRNSVIGKVSRLGLSLERSSVYFKRPRRRPLRRRRVKPVRVCSSLQTEPAFSCAAPAALAASAEMLHVSFLEAKSQQCRYPASDNPLTVCGLPTCDVGSKSYCAQHARVCYVFKRSH